MLHARRNHRDDGTRRERGRENHLPVNDIQFDFGKSTIRPESDTYLNKLAQTLIRTNANIEVKSHTDNVGTEEFNLKLSKNVPRP